jgi:thiol-disulfide isomerase/thioredoxin
MTAPGWYPDPTGRFEQRWFDGTNWSPSVSRAGQQFTDDPAAPAPVPTQPGFGPPPGFGSTPISDLIAPAPGPQVSDRKVGFIVAAVFAAVAIVAVGVVLVVRSSDSTDSVVRQPVSSGSPADNGGTAPASTSAPTSSVAVIDETSRPVTVVGDPLPIFDYEPDPAVGTLAPVLQGFDFDGNPITIDAAADGPYMVVFLAHWCPHCNREIPRLLEWQAQGGVPAGLKVIAVATAVASDAPNYPPKEWLAAKDWTWPAMIDESTGPGMAGVAAEAYGASGWPYFVIVGADGNVKLRASGEIEIDDLQTMVEEALAS